MKISIIIPCYNEYEYIDKVINNILSKNSQFDLEIIIKTITNVLFSKGVSH